MTVTVDPRLALTEAIAATARAGQEIVELARGQAFEIREKSGTELVTTADLRSDELIRDHLHARFPRHRFFSEEVASPAAMDFAGPVWIVDPIDGTANYVHGYPYVSISVALAVDGEPQVAVVQAPFLGETYAALRGQGPRLSLRREMQRMWCLLKELPCTGHRDGRCQAYVATPLRAVLRMPAVVSGRHTIIPK